MAKGVANTNSQKISYHDNDLARDITQTALDTRQIRQPPTLHVLELLPRLAGFLRKPEERMCIPGHTVDLSKADKRLYIVLGKRACRFLPFFSRNGCEGVEHNGLEEFG